MNLKTSLVELILAGFFAIACVRSAIPSVAGEAHFADLVRFPGRIERLRRSRWQWFSMIALLLMIRLQQGMPFVLEATVAILFVIFVALPTKAVAIAGARAR